MPAIITHDFFGQDLLATHPEYAGAIDERQAFMLGCQGPDPLFYLVVNPTTGPWKPLGTIIHTERPSALLANLCQAVDTLDEDEHSIGLAYARGFLAHYALDSNVHPLVYAQEFALCNAGINGLTQRDSRYVHAAIETSIDEVVLFSKRQETIRLWRPYKHILQASETVLDIVSYLYARMVQDTYQLEPPAGLFTQAVKCFRATQRAFYTPNNVARKALGAAERLGKRHSLYSAMSHRPVASYVCEFDNHDYLPWTNPFTGKTSTLDFWRLYQQAGEQAVVAIEAFEQTGLGEAGARAITNGLNFSGDPVE